MKIGSGGNYLKIEILNRKDSQSNDYWDSNWISSSIEIKINGVFGQYSTNLRTDDFERFSIQLKNLQAKLVKGVEFLTVEEGIQIKGEINDCGNINWVCIAKSEFGKFVLSFSVESDLSDLEDLIEEVKRDLSEYPVINDEKTKSAIS